MSNVTLLVGGRNYTVACADGQEEHVRKLALLIDDKLKSMGSNLSNNEAKNLLFAALFLADELAEREQPPEQAAPEPFDSDRLGAQLERVAVALENAAAALERGAIDT